MDFKREKVSGTEHEYLTTFFTQEEICKALDTAYLKSQHTMNNSQAGKVREPIVKFQNQLQGILSEMAVEGCLNDLFKNNDNVLIERYDNVRTDGFRFSRNEFDIRLHLLNEKDGSIGKSFDFEIRSSKHRHDFNKSESLFNNVLQKPIIGPYESRSKNQEAYSDFYIRPIMAMPSYGDNDKDAVLKHLYQNNTKILLLGGCGIKTMKENSYIGSLFQPNTKYMLVDLKDNDMISFSKKLVSFVNKQDKKLNQRKESSLSLG